MNRQISFLGLGDGYLAPYGGGAAALPIGSASEVTLGISEDKKTQKNYGRDGGNLSTVSRIDSVTVTIAMQSLNASNIALATRGTASEVEAGTATGETHTAYPGGLIRLDNINPSSVVVNNDAGDSTFVEGTDYRLTPAGVIPLEGGAIAEGDTVSIDYEYSARQVIQALTASQGEYLMTFDGLNEANSDRPVIVDLHRIKFGPTENLSLVGDDYGSINLTGELIIDPAKIGAAESKFFRYEYVE